jgi:hypothetical protein
LVKCFEKTIFKTVIPDLIRNPVAPRWIPAYAGMTIQKGVTAALTLVTSIMVRQALHERKNALHFV